MPRIDKHINPIISTSKNQTSSLLGKTIYPAVVVSIDDNLQSNRIKARITSYKDKFGYNISPDEDFTDDELPFAVPLIPNFIEFKPKVGELVFVIPDSVENIYGLRYYVGPITLNEFKYFISEKEAKEIVENKIDIRKKKKEYDNVDLNEDLGNISIHGKDDSDILFKSKSVVIQAGRDNNSYPSYIKLSNIDNNSSVLIKSNEVKILTEDNGINYSAVYAEILVDILKTLILAVVEHVHIPQAPPADSYNILKLKEYLNSDFLKNIIAENIKIK